jgi:Nif-specific regulatory protein
MPPQTSHQTPIDWHRQELLLLREVVKLVGKSLTPDVVIREMLHLMSELLGLNRGRLVLRHPEAGPHAASIRHAYGLTTEQVQLGHYMLNEGITGKVLATGQPVIVQDVDAEPAFLFRTVSRAELPQDTVSFLALPVLVSGEVRGVFACHRIRSRQRHLNDDLSILSVLATLCGQMLQLDEMVREKTETLEAQNALLSHALESQTTRFGIVGHSAKLLRSLGELERVAPSNATVLLLGESGTGKELFARALHLLSPRLEARSPVRRRRGPDCSNRRRAARSSSTKLANCLCPCNQNFCAPCRKT